MATVKAWLNDGKILMSDGRVCLDPLCPCDGGGGGGGDTPSEFECFCCESGDVGRTPAFWTVEIPAGTNNGCTDCATVAGTYELQQGCCGGTAETQSCDYELDPSGADCTLDYMLLNVICGESNQLQFNIATSDVATADGQWLYEDFEASFSCVGSYDLDFSTGSETQCTWTGTTVTVTSSLST